jgi:preprotein translocase subunit SecF
MSRTVTRQPSVEQAPVKPKRGLWHRLYHGQTRYDFVGRRWWYFIGAGLVILVGIVSLSTRGLNLGLDFKGGVVWEVPVENGISTSDAATILSDNGISPSQAKIQTLSQGDNERLRVQVSAQDAETQVNVTQDFAQRADVSVNDISFTSVSPTWGDEITRKALIALFWFLLAIALYVSFRFEWRMAVAALVALAHDLLVSVGLYSLFGFEVTPQTVIAFLTILGFSLYDTVVVFDKIHENVRRLAPERVTYTDIVNLSMNQVLMRSINTTVAALLPIVSLLVVGAWIMGAVALQEFALALFIGLLVGTFSSIFIASPLLCMLKERQPKWRAIRERADRSATTLDDLRTASRAPRPAAVGAAGERSGPTITTVAPQPSGLTHPPRPRKKKRR